LNVIDTLLLVESGSILISVPETNGYCKEGKVNLAEGNNVELKGFQTNT